MSAQLHHIALAALIAALVLTFPAECVRAQTRLDFNLVQRGSGLRESNSAYEASDGTYVNVHIWTFQTENEARMLVEWQRERLEPETLVAGPSTAAAGRITLSGFYVDLDGRQRFAAIEQSGRLVKRMDATTEKHLEAFVVWCAIRAAAEFVENSASNP